MRMGIDTSQRDGWSAVGKKDVLYDLPVSNHGGRVRMIVYEKRIDKKIDFQEPSKLGGLKSQAYLGVFPTGKMPGMLKKAGVLPSILGVAEGSGFMYFGSSFNCCWRRLG